MAWKPAAAKKKSKKAAPKKSQWAAIADKMLDSGAPEGSAGVVKKSKPWSSQQ